ncbi:hypothetical protein Sjap_025863 [Stephania japonica]|uniref:Uncharacterized protein n=1 Tax=Stephania japonica TaxID=461633 RepID=A0AAP0HHY0_9MAGN
MLADRTWPSVTSWHVSMRRGCNVGHRADPDACPAGVGIAGSILWKIFTFRNAHLISLGILTLDSSFAFSVGLSADPSTSRGKGKLPEVRSRGADVTRADSWVEGHKNKKGRPHSDEIARVVDPITQVFGPEHQGRVRGLGFGVTPTSVRAITQSSILVRKLQGDFQRLEEKHEQLAELVRSQQMPPYSQQQQNNPPNLRGKKCKIFDWLYTSKLVGEGEIETDDPMHLVDGIPIGGVHRKDDSHVANEGEISGGNQEKEVKATQPQGRHMFIILSCSIAVGTNLCQFICIARFTAVSFQVVGHMKMILVLILGFIFFGKDDLNLQSSWAFARKLYSRYEKQPFFDLSLLSPITPPQAPGPSLPGMYRSVGQLGVGNAILIIVQLCVAGIIVMCLDEILQKGYILGSDNTQQQNFHVLYDTKNSRLGCRTLLDACFFTRSCAPVTMKARELLAAQSGSGTAVSGAGFYASATPQLDDLLKHVAQQFLTVLIFSLLSCLTGLLLAGLEVQDPDNSSQTVYDSWIGSGSTPTISFSSIVFPAILCAYAGQAAYFTKSPGDVTDTFYKSISGIAVVLGCLKSRDPMLGKNEFEKELIKVLYLLRNGHLRNLLQMLLTEAVGTFITEGEYCWSAGLCGMSNSEEADFMAQLLSSCAVPSELNDMSHPFGNPYSSSMDEKGLSDRWTERAVGGGCESPRTYAASTLTRTEQAF